MWNIEQDAHVEANQEAVGTATWRYRLIDVAVYPWRYGFISLLRATAAQHPHLPPIGRATLPRQEPFRLGQRPSMTFSPREIAAVDPHVKHPQIRLFGLGMLGPNGPLPIHFTEIAKDRLDNRHDATLVDFLDKFHHRYMTHMYRAWSQAQAAAGLDRADDEQFSQYVSRLAGNDPVNIRSSPLPPHARMAASAHLVREARNPDGLAMTLAHFFGVPVQIEEHVLHWISVSSDEHTLLGRASVATVMGEGALLGEAVPDRQHKFRIVIGPLSLAQYLHLTPQGRDLPLLVEWVRAFVGLEYGWEVELKVAAAAATPARIGGAEKLGWATWLGDSDTTRAATGMVFEPEQYMRQGSRLTQGGMGI
ncbi:type VI secretion system baseplate subunit TssG [Collimonas antrihumi]|uniref:type VI secretion system baseplate subunit TssG n=1 Tax=Collimonas antrihumi TaxID=1940615 RepID=UPI001B8B045A|nr:type VI secretion system baseplate subunit TssG [Collimonas antrihumi]